MLTLFITSNKIGNSFQVGNFLLRRILAYCLIIYPESTNMSIDIERKALRIDLPIDKYGEVVEIIRSFGAHNEIYSQE